MVILWWSWYTLKTNVCTFGLRYGFWSFQKYAWPFHCNNNPFYPYVSSILIGWLSECSMECNYNTWIIPIFLRHYSALRITMLTLFEQNNPNTIGCWWWMIRRIFFLNGWLCLILRCIGLPKNDVTIFNRGANRTALHTINLSTFLMKGLNKLCSQSLQKPQTLITTNTVLFPKHNIHH